MTRKLQLLRGTTAQNNAFTGSSGELTVDTTTNELRLHDGSTAGGHIIYNKLDVDTALSGKANVATTLAGYGITDGANTDLSNLTITGKATGAHLAMPSSTYDNLTLGASGSSYTAPADGWFVLIKEATALYQYIDMSGAGGIETGATAAISGSQYLYALLPASKGSSISIYYTAAGSTIKFRFVHANGAA